MLERRHKGSTFLPSGVQRWIKLGVSDLCSIQCFHSHGWVTGMTSVSTWFQWFCPKASRAWKPCVNRETEERSYIYKWPRQQCLNRSMYLQCPLILWVARRLHRDICCSASVSQQVDVHRPADDALTQNSSIHQLSRLHSQYNHSTFIITQSVENTHISFPLLCQTSSTFRF